MKVISTIIVILLAQCVHLQPFVPTFLKDVLKEQSERKIPKNILKSTAESVNNKLLEWTDSCVFGVKSVGIILYNREFPDGEVIALNETSAAIDPNKQIIFLVHGFLSDANRTISYKLSKELVEENYTVLSVDWSEGACTNGIPIVKFTEYPFAVKNTREIGEFMAKYVEWLTVKHKVLLSKITFIGHSLGAHVCGFAAKQVKNMTLGNIIRIIAADPAAPLFEFNYCEDRLCKTDAEQVISLHTSPLGASSFSSTNLQFNNAISQPGCLPIDVPCAHSKSVDYILDILKGCELPAVPNTYPRKYPDHNTTNCITVNKNMLMADSIKGNHYVFVEPYCAKEKSFSCK